MAEIPADLLNALRHTGLIDARTPPPEPLAGGVSCDVWKLCGPAGAIVLKQPLAQLRVAADWQAPVERATSEVRWLQRAREVDARMAPEVLADFPAHHAFVLRFVPDCPVWKDELIAGRVDGEFAAAVGQRIAALHSATAHNLTDRQAFPTDAMFRELRVDPFILHVARRNRRLAPALQAIADDLTDRKIALVHGDVSPKNILVGSDGPLFLDAECAVYGDPAFDLAFCTTHLLLKSVWLGDARLQESAAALVAAYRDGVDWEEPIGLLRRAGALTAALLLARVEGKSPAPYLTSERHKAVVRKQAVSLLGASHRLDLLVARWKRTAE